MAMSGIGAAHSVRRSDIGWSRLVSRAAEFGREALRRRRWRRAIAAMDDLALADLGVSRAQAAFAIDAIRGRRSGAASGRDPRRQMPGLRRDDDADRAASA
jgi:uncharacterized protein YjiS (DUF1127 family)